MTLAEMIDLLQQVPHPEDLDVTGVSPSRLGGLTIGAVYPDEVAALAEALDRTCRVNRPPGCKSYASLDLGYAWISAECADDWLPTCPYCKGAGVDEDFPHHECHACGGTGEVAA